MYHALLTNRYLTTRVIPLIAVAAVALCVALVIIVVSVMTGFLNMVKNSGRTLIGDVVISYPVDGIPYYERLIDRIGRLPEAAAVTPVVDGFGLLKLPYSKAPKPVQFWGIEPESFAAVTGYEKTLYWRELNAQQREWLFADVITKHWKDVLAGMNDDQRVRLVRRVLMTDPTNPQTMPDEQVVRQRLNAFTEDAWRQFFSFIRREPDELKQILTPEQWQKLVAYDPRLADPDAILKEGLTLRFGESDRAIVMGMHVSEGNVRQRDGSYTPMGQGRWWMPRHEVTLTTLPVAGGVGGAESAESRILKVVNEFVSGVFLIDDKRVMIPLPVAQDMLHLSKAERLDDPDDPFKVTGEEPAKATMVLVRAKPGVTPEQLRDAVRAAYDQFTEEVAADQTATVLPPQAGFGLTVQTWAEQQASFIGPVEKEREMMRTLFSLVYIVCAGLVLAIFWAIVYEKTRDIGILRSVGASRMGISWIFLRYGLLIGMAGAVVGLGLAYLVVRNINAIHEALGNPPLWLALAVMTLAVASLIVTIVRSMTGRLLPVVVGSLVTLVLGVIGLLATWLYDIGGVIIWNPEVYYFTKIPNEVDMNSAYITMIGAVVFSLIGAFVPAAKAADTDPVKALRYE